MNYIKTRDDINLVREYLKENYNFGDMYSLLFTCGCNFGLRVSDLRLLTFGDLKKPHFEIIEKKTKKKRCIFVNRKVATEFNSFLNGHKYNNSIRKYLFVNDDAKIFVSRKGEELDEKSIYRIIRTACENVGLSGHYGSHTMRKTFAYHCYQIALDIEVVKRLLLHSDTFVTRTYISSRDFEVVSNLNNSIEMSDEDIYLELNL